MISVNIFHILYRRLCLMNLLWTATMLRLGRLVELYLFWLLSEWERKILLCFTLINIAIIVECCESAGKGRKNIYQLQLKSFSSPEVGKAFQWRIHLILHLPLLLNYWWSLEDVSLQTLQSLDVSTRFHLLSRQLFLFVKNVAFFFSRMSSWIHSTPRLRFSPNKTFIPCSFLSQFSSQPSKCAS